MEGHAKKCVERYCELANRTTQQLYKVSTPCIDDHHFKEEELKSVGELSKVCFQIVLKCLYLARIGRPDILWSVNKLARSITKWTKACDKRMNRLISYIHHTCEYKQCCYVGNTAKQCRLGLFQDSDFVVHRTVDTSARAFSRDADIALTCGLTCGSSSRLCRPHKNKFITMSSMFAPAHFSCSHSTPFTHLLPRSLHQEQPLRSRCRPTNTALLRQMRSLALWPKLPPHRL